MITIDNKYVDKPPVEQHQPGAKLDQGKNRLGLVLGGFSKALQAVGEVGTAGANKYSPNGWKEVNNGIERYTDAMLRHYMLHADGEKYDQELSELSGKNIPHMACVAWNALAVLNLMIEQNEKT
jgi:hypothetical protein